MKKFVNNAEKMIGGLFLLAIIILSFIQVVSRKLGYSLAWSEEYALLCFVWFGYLGASACALEGKHLKVGFLLERLPRRMSVALTLFLNLLWLTVNVFIGLAAYHYTAHAYFRHSTTIITKTPYWIVIAAVPVGLLLMSLRIIQRSWLLIQVERAENAVKGRD